MRTESGVWGSLRCCAVTSLCVSQVTATEFAWNNHCCLSQSLISKVYIIASLIFLEGCIESSTVDIELLGKSTGPSAEVNEIDWEQYEHQLSIVNNVLLFCFICTCDWNGICSAKVLGDGPVVWADCQEVNKTALECIVLSVLSEMEELVFHPPAWIVDLFLNSNQSCIDWLFYFRLQHPPSIVSWNKWNKAFRFTRFLHGSVLGRPHSGLFCGPPHVAGLLLSRWDGAFMELFSAQLP